MGETETRYEDGMKKSTNATESIANETVIVPANGAKFTEAGNIPPVKKKKKRSVFKGIMITLLVILFLPFVLTGLLYLYVSVSDFTYDNPGQVVSQNEPMSFTERNSFNRADHTRTVLLDNSDLYYLSEDIIPDLHFSDSVYINAYRIALEDKAIYLQGKAYGINLPIKIAFDVVGEDGSLLVTVKDAFLGKWLIPIPIRWIAEKMDMQLDYEIAVDTVSFFKDAQKLWLDAGYIKVTYPVNMDVLAEGTEAWAYLKPALLYQQEEDEMVLLVAEFEDNWNDRGFVGPVLESFIKKLEISPDAYQELKVSMLAAAPESFVEEYFTETEQEKADRLRFYPGISMQAVEEMREQLYYTKNYEFLEQFAFYIDEQFGNVSITIRDHQFIDISSGRTIELGSLLEEMPGAGNVFPEGTKLHAVLCEGAKGLQKIGDTNYSCATVIQFKNGKCAVLCWKERNFYLPEITLQEYEDLISGEQKAFIVSFLG